MSKHLTTTLNAIREHGPCEDSWKKLLKGLGKSKPDDKPLRFSTIRRICGLDDALWACRAAPQYDKTWRLLAVRYAREVQHLMADQRSLDALDVAERHARGNATDAELAAARAAAGDAWAAAQAAAGDAWAAAGDAARSAALDAAWAAARSAALDAAWAAARDAARRKQSRLFLAAVSGKPIQMPRRKRHE